jgi:phosphoribosylamine--glycine ligase
LRVLIVGAGGREHALAWKLSQDSARPLLFAAPGNAGTAAVAENLPISPTDVTGLIDFADRSGIDLTIVGPEAPLAAGIVDAFRARGLRIFGPSRAAARLETSKVFAKELMRRRGIPTAAFEVFYSPLAAIEYAERQRRPLVVKADGLAAGKGVVVAQTPDEAQRAIEEMLIRGTLGDAGRRIVIEDRLEGSEASLLVLVGPGGVRPLVPAQDYKRLSDGDRGPNTGGMGAIAPVDLVAGTDLAGISYPVPVGEIVNSIVEPVLGAMRRDGSPYTGVLYVGLMLTAEGPKVLEFNCRFGDPEAQVILPLLESDLATALLDVIDGRDPELQWRDEFAGCVVLASSGYPGSYSTGLPIRGLDAIPDDVLVFHAGTRPDGDAIVTSGGRVLNLVGRGPSLAAAVERAYAGTSAVSFDGMHFRRDVGRESLVEAPA